MLSPVKAMIFSSILQQILRRWGVSQVKKVESSTKESVLSDLSTLSLKILSGLMIVAVIIYATSRLINEVSIYFAQFYYGPLYNVLLFTALILIGFATLYFIFSSREKKKKQQDRDSHEMSGSSTFPQLPMGKIEDLDLQQLTQSFMSGFSTGLKRDRRRSSVVYESGGPFDSKVHSNQ